MSRELMIVLIVAIVMISVVLKARYRAKSPGHGLPDARGTGDNAEARQLREEMKALKERLAVLERITVEKENSLAREIEDLRGR
jgi:hypothetical protein